MNRKSLKSCTRFSILLNTFMLWILFIMTSNLKTLSLIQIPKSSESSISVKLFNLTRPLKPYSTKAELLLILRPKFSKTFLAESSIFGLLGSFFSIFFLELFTFTVMEKTIWRKKFLRNLLFLKVLFFKYSGNYWNSRSENVKDLILKLL